jgi:hypothetical protein
MPQRKAIRQVPTPTVQGDDSWVKVHRLEMGKWLAYQANGDGKEDTQIEQARRGLRLMAELIVGWNWVDDDGAPLPQPGTDPAVLERLTDEETNLLMGILQGPSEAQVKN